MAEFNIEDKMKNFKFNSKINILLLGASGVGKSTLINAFANYATFTDFEEATKNKPMVLIPSQFTVFDKEFNVHDITTEDAVQNEVSQTGGCSTQDVKTYVFPIWDKAIKICLIDTPGLIDNKGEEEKDDIKADNILRYIANLHKLHAICFLLKPNEARHTVNFQYYIDKIFSRLDKKACENIIFCFTHTRGFDYGPGASIKMLEKAINELTRRPPYANVGMKGNIFYFDNEPFNYLTAVQKGIHFGSNIKERNKESWEKSAEQSWRLIKYITGDNKNKPLRPYFVRSTYTINEARRFIKELLQPLADITLLIHHNMNVLQRHKEVLNAKKPLEEWKNELYIPVIKLEFTTLSQPVTVCTGSKCRENYSVRELHYYRYKRCHDPCCLKQVPEEVIGAPELKQCEAMDGISSCVLCTCSFKVHKHVYYLTETVEKREIDKTNVTDEVELKKSKHQIIENIEVRRRELDDELGVVLAACAKFVHFLQTYATTPFNDYYETLIRSFRDRQVPRSPIYYKLDNFLSGYGERKKSLDKVLEMNKTIDKDAVINAQDVSEAINKLYRLKHNGKIIKELYNFQKNARTKEFKNIGYIHKAPCKGIKIEAVQETGNRENPSGKEHLNRGYYDSDNSDSD